MLPMAVARSFSGDVLDTLCASGFVGDGVLAHNHPDKGVFSNRLTRGITEPRTESDVYKALLVVTKVSVKQRISFLSS